MGCKPAPPRLPSNDLGPHAQKDPALPTESAEWRILADDRDRWRLVCGGSSKQPATSARNRQAIWAELRNGPVQRVAENTNIMRKITYNQPNRHMSGEQQKQSTNTQLAFFWLYCLLIAQCKMHYGDYLLDLICLKNRKRTSNLYSRFRQFKRGGVVKNRNPPD